LDAQKRGTTRALVNRLTAPNAATHQIAVFVIADQALPCKRAKTIHGRGCEVL
jgi:hypothetical protein